MPSTEEKLRAMEQDLLNEISGGGEPEPPRSPEPPDNERKETLTDEYAADCFVLLRKRLGGLNYQIVQMSIPGGDTSEFGNLPTPDDLKDQINAKVAELEANFNQNFEVSSRVRNVINNQKSSLDYSIDSYLFTYQQLVKRLTKQRGEEDEKEKEKEKETPADQKDAKPTLTQQSLADRFDFARTEIIDKAITDLKNRVSSDAPADVWARAIRGVALEKLRQQFEVPDGLLSLHQQWMLNLSWHRRKYVDEYYRLFEQPLGTAAGSGGERQPPEPPRSSEPSRPPEPPAELEVLLAEAREKYVRAQHRLKDTKGFMGLKGFLKKESRKTVEQEVAAAEQAYELARAELMISGADKFIGQLRAEAEERFRKNYKDKPGLIKAWNKVGEWNFYTQEFERKGKNVDSWLGRAGLRMLSVRTGVSLALLGAAVMTGGAVAAAAIYLRRTMGATGAAIGLSELYTNLAVSKQEKVLNAKLAVLNRQGENASEKELTETLAVYELVNCLRGRNPSEDARYQVLLLVQQKKFAGWLEAVREGGTMTTEETAQRLTRGRKDREQAVKQEVGKRKRRALGAAAAGAFVGGGGLSLAKRAFGAAGDLVSRVRPADESAPVGGGQDIHLPSKNLPESTPRPDFALDGTPQPAASADTVPVGRSPAEPIPGTAEEISGASGSSAAAVETTEPYGETIRQAVTSRGIEGDLLDFKDQYPEKYQQMIEWLKQQEYNKGVKDDGSLIHRFVLDYVKQNNFNVDSGAKDLSRIFAGNIEIGPGGQITLSVGNDDFMPERTPSPSPSPQGGGELSAKGEGSDQPLRITIPDSETDFRAGPKEPIRLQFNTPAEAPVEPGAVPEAADDSVIRDRMTEAEEIAVARRNLALTADKTSDALNLTLQDDYHDFARDTLRLTDKELNEVGSRGVADFIFKVRQDPEFALKYHNLSALVNEANADGGFDNASVKELLVNTADDHGLAERVMTAENERIVEELVRGGKPAEAIKRILSGPDYKDFMGRTLDMSPRDLNRIGDMDVGEFLKRGSEETKFAKRYQIFGAALERIRERDGLNENLKIGQLILQLARDYKKI